MVSFFFCEKPETAVEHLHKANMVNHGKHESVFVQAERTAAFVQGSFFYTAMLSCETTELSCFISYLNMRQTSLQVVQHECARGNMHE